MRFKLEGVNHKKALDADVEKDGAKEIKYDNDKDSYDYLFDDELREHLDEMQSIDEYDIGPIENAWQGLDDNDMAPVEREKPDLWNKNDLGKYTINTPTSEKKTAEHIEETQMEPVNESEYQEIADSVDEVDAKLQKAYEEIIAEFEGKF